MTEDELKAWDLYAAAALGGLLSLVNTDDVEVWDEHASWATEEAGYRADVMIEERRKRARTVKKGGV